MDYRYLVFCNISSASAWCTLVRSDPVESDRREITYLLCFRPSPEFPKRTFCNGDRKVHGIIANYLLNSEVRYCISLDRPTQSTSSVCVRPVSCLLASHLPTLSLILHPKTYGRKDTTKLCVVCCTE